MKMYADIPLRHFQFWGGAKDTVAYLTASELDEIESLLEDIYPEGMHETAINDYFWFDDDHIAYLLGYEDFSELMKARPKE